MRYYDMTRHWSRKIVPHLGDAELNDVLVRDFNKFTWGRWRRKFTLGQLPAQFESCDWRDGHRGPSPRYWAYLKHSAGHWLVNFALRLAILAEPKKAWRIITSDKHSTVWDGKHTLFDLNFLALGISPKESFELAYDQMLPPGKYMKVFYAEHYTRTKAQ
jgi:hypothetical protein